MTPNPKEPGDLSAKEAAAFLDVKLPTLYAYVSRGLLRSVPGTSGKARRYRKDDLERLKARHDARSGHGPVAAGALRWGEPVLDSAITSVSGERLRYRGHDAVELGQRGVGFEAAAELLWTGELPPSPPRWSADGLGYAVGTVASLLGPGASPLTALSLVVPVLGASDLGRFGASAEVERARARSLILRLAASLALPLKPVNAERAMAAPSVAHAAAVALGAKPSAPVVRALNLALLLLADHELNASTFAARVTASTGADLYACVTSALAALSGPRHGAHCDQVEALVAEVGRPEHTAEALHLRARRGEGLPGFGHPLYPSGDPRARPLLEAAMALAPKDPGVRVVHAIVQAVADKGGEPPTTDLGLVAVAAAAGLPRGSASALFALGRTAGWVAHALEQREAGFMLRPRARYVGR